MNIPKLKTEITKEDIKELGLKCGIEIHQQLEGKKLFCNCPTIIRDDKEDFIVKRHLRASAGESGKVDAAALAEQKKKKHFLYEGYDDTTCLVEIDEEPPHDVNKSALNSSLQIAKILDMDIADQVRFMRKTVVDGSNTSGFQRTGLIAVDGKLIVNKQNKKESFSVGIESLCLEEDSAKNISDTAEAKTYNLSRLGIPLIEIATAPDMKTPEQIKAVAEEIGMILRSLDNVKRGLGTIRQDVNISIKEGLRVEIKGAQDLKMIPTLAKSEMLRQHNLLRIFEELKKRKAHANHDIIDLSLLFKDSTSKVIRSGLDAENGSVLGLKLEGFVGITGSEIQSGRRYGSELSDYAKTMGVKGLFHADELPKYGITPEQKKAIYHELKADPKKDSFIIISAPEGVARRALASAQERANDLNLRNQVRMALPDGNSSYMRPMPGAARMYPETDVSPEIIDKEKIIVPKLLSEKIFELVSKFGIAEDIAKRLIRDDLNLEVLTNEYENIKTNFIIDLYYSTPSLIKKKHGVDIDIKIYAPVILERLNEGLITKDSIIEIILKLHSGEKVNYNDYKALNIEDISDDIKKLLKEMKGAPVGAVIGKAMNKYKGKIDGKVLTEFIRNLM